MLNRQRSGSPHARTGGQVVVETLEAFGVDVVFGIPGVHNLSIYEALRGSDSIRHILARHEQGIGFMADGYARTTGRVGVGIAISGPGVTNVLTPLAGAYAESSPILIIATGLDVDGEPQSHGILHELKNQFEMAAATAGWARRVDDPDDISQAVADALEALEHGRPRGAYLQVSLSALNSVTSAPVVGRREIGRPVPDAGALQRAGELLGGSARPLIMAGSGVDWARAAHELEELAGKLGAPVILGPKSSDLLPSGHPLRYSLPRFHQNPEIENIIAQADVILAVGTKLGEERMSRAAHDIRGDLIRVDIDPDEVTRRYEPTVPVLADAKDALTHFTQMSAP